MCKKRMFLLEQEIKRLQREYVLGEQIVVLHINHFLDNSLVFNHLLQRLFKDIIFLGVPYHTEIKDLDECWHLTYPCYYGWWQQDCFSMFRNHIHIAAYRGNFQQVCKDMLDYILDRELLPAIRKGKKLLVLEDGGYISQYWQDWKKKYPELAGSIIGSVEQTTSGTRLNKRCYDLNGYDFPCISIARTDLKMDIESIFICSRILRELERLLYELDTFLEFHYVFLLGYGVLGRLIGKLLHARHIDFCVYDSDNRICRLAYKDGCSVIDKLSNISFWEDTIIIGVTGEEAFTIEMLETFQQSDAKRLYLASGSSKQTEFQTFLRYVRQNHLSLSSEEGFYLLPDGKGRGEKRVYLLADGMPLNFHEKAGGSLTFSVIDFIFTEMVLCGYCLVRKKLVDKRMYLAGVDMIPELDEKQIFDKWCKIYGLWHEYPDSHPEKDYLRRMIYDKKGL